MVWTAKLKGGTFVCIYLIFCVVFVYFVNFHVNKKLNVLSLSLFIMKDLYVGYLVACHCMFCNFYLYRDIVLF